MEENKMSEELTKAETVNPEVRYAGFWIRLLADILDGLILTVVSWILQMAILGVFYGIWVALGRARGEMVPGFAEAFSPFFLQMFNVGVYFCIAFPYYVWGHFRWGTTLGKLPLRIYVVQAESLASVTLKQSIIRFFGYGLSYAIFLTGFLMAAFQPEKRALHDLLAGTVSVRK